MQFPKFEILNLSSLNLFSLANTGPDTSLYGFACQMEICAALTIFVLMHENPYNAVMQN